MAKFSYQGKDSEGKLVEQTVEAADRYAVYALARDLGHSITRIKEIHRQQVGNIFNYKKIDYLIHWTKDDEMVMTTRNLGSMLAAGLTVSRALSVVERQSNNPRLQRVMGDLRGSINKGDSFYEALRSKPKVFNKMYVSMVKAGEESGRLAESLQTLAIQMERSSSLRKKIKGAMIYPAIVITVMIIIGMLMMIYVMPQITGVFKNMNKELPDTTVFLISLSDFLVNYTVLVVGGIVAVVAGVAYFLKTTWGRIASSWLVVRLPVIGNLAKETNAARTARTLSSLLGSGVDMIQAIDITEEVLQNVFYKKILREASIKVAKGTALSEVFVENNKLYPVLVGEMILVGEETGQISNMLRELAIFYENEVERKTKDLSTIIEPLLMVFIGGTVGFFALALIAPIYSLSDSLQ